MAHRDKTQTRTLKSDERSDDGILYFYQLIVREDRNQASFRIPLYSVAVKMIDKDGDESEASVKDAFCDPGRALVFYDKVVRNLATPIDLAYILEDEMR